MPRSRKKPSSDSDTSTKRKALDTGDSPRCSTYAEIQSSKSADTSDVGKSLMPGGAGNTCFIYGLHAGDGVIRYIGMSKKPQVRLKQHVCDSTHHRGVNKHKESWIRTVIAAGREVGAIVLQQCDDDNWKDAERDWIARFGNTLTNMAPGGDQPSCAIETRIANASILNTHSDKPLFIAKRWFAWAAKQAAMAGNMLQAKKMLECMLEIECCKGEARKRLRQWAAERFCNGKEKTSRQAA